MLIQQVLIEGLTIAISPSSLITCKGIFYSGAWMTHTDILIERTAAATYTSSGVSVLGAFTANEVATIGGFVVGVVALAVNWYYRHKTFTYEKKLAEAKLKKLEGQK